MTEVQSEIAQYGFTNDKHVDEIMRAYTGLSAPRPYLTRNRGFGVFDGDCPNMMIAILQWYGTIGLENMVLAVLKDTGWSRKSWVRIHMIYMICVWPKMYIDLHGHEPVSWLEWDRAAFVADNIEDLVGRDF